jgi:ABC-2 type transport system permease protein
MLIVFLSPLVFFLTGVAWPLESLPVALKVLAYLFPATPMVPAFIKLRLIGGGISSISHELVVINIQFAGYFILALFSYRMATKSFVRRVEAIGRSRTCLHQGIINATYHGN